MPGILYVVATPIGNLEDVTLRGLRILREVSVIAAEDTRRTAKLLQHYSISTPTTSLHEHNERQRLPQLVARLKAGESVALVSDAGTPAISDPGARLIAAAHEAGIVVQPVPGANAIVATISASGMGSEGFVFVGFAPAKRGARQRWLTELREERRPIAMYEAPHRIGGLLEDIADVLGDRTVVVGRELTKVHEQLAVRPIKQWLADPPPHQGEFTLLISPALPTDGLPESQAGDQQLANEYLRVTRDTDVPRRDAIRAVASKYGVSARRVFAAVDGAKNSGE